MEQCGTGHRREPRTRMRKRPHKGKRLGVRPSHKPVLWVQSARGQVPRAQTAIDQRSGGVGAL
eukprot:1248935-Heterocapsa_arctica.AAC.1